MTAADMHRPGKKVPNGAQQNVWMCLMAGPNDHHNEVYQNIILGDDHLAKSASELSALGVTHVVNCACGKRLNMIDTNAEYFAASGIRFHGIAATDIMTFKMAPHFEAASKFMKDALDGGGKLYVHCVSGVSRSATIVLAYLLSVHRMPLMTALEHVRKHRKIMPNDGFLKELVELNNRMFGS